MENILIVDSYSTGENFLEDIKKRGYHPIVLWSKRNDLLFQAMESHRNPIMKKYKDEVDFYIEKDTYEETLSMVKELNPKFVLPGGELGVELATMLAADLNLPGNKKDRIPYMTNKSLMHQALAEHGVREIRGKVVHNLEEALDFYHSNNLKGAVLKPYRGAGSVDVRLCDSEEELRAAYDEVFASGNYMGGEEEGMLLQERIIGTEYVVNTVSYQGRHKLTSILRYLRKKVPGGGNAYDRAEMLGTLETGCSSLVRYMFSALNALGIEYGNVHAELMMDEKGPVLIEVNCRPMGFHLRADYMDKIWGHHETDLVLDAYLHPEAFLSSIHEPFRSLSCGWMKMVIVEGDKDIVASPILTLARHQKSFFYADLGKSVSGHVTKTVDLDTAGGTIYLANDDRGQLLRDYDFLERVETQYYDMLYSGKRKEPSEMPSSLQSIGELLDEINPIGSVLLLSNEIRLAPGLTCVSEEEIEKVRGGFQYGVLDLNYLEDEDYESMTEDFFRLVSKVRSGGYIIVPERTYWHFSYGIESIEILAEAAGLLIEAPNMDSGKYVCLKKN